MQEQSQNGDVPAADGIPVYELSGVGRKYGSGASGSGKTTLLQLLGALDRPSSGTIRCLGKDVDRMGGAEPSRLRRDTIGFIFQQFNLIPTLTALQNVEAAIASRRGGDRRSRARELLQTVGLGHRVDHLPSRMSGGEQQRVAIARALSNAPGALLADEPTGNLDSATGDEILALLRGLSTEHGQTVVLVTHDTHVAETAPRTVRLRDGRVYEDSARVVAVASDPI